MRRDEFIRRVRRAGRERGVSVRFSAHRGKESHGTLYCGERHTVVKGGRSEFSKGLLSAMCKQLGIDPSEL